MSASVTSRAPRALPVLHPLRPTCRAATALLPLLLAAACSDGATTPGAEPFDPARVLRAAAPLDLAAAGALGAGAGTAGPGISLPGLLPSDLAGGACAWTDAAQAFVCQPVVTAGIRFSARWIALDAAGRALRKPTTANTAALRVVSTLSGTFDPASPGTPVMPPGAPRPGPFTVDATEDRTVSGLLTGRYVVDGTGTFRSEIAVAGRPVRSEGRTTLTGVVLPTGGQRWPQAGTVTSEVVDLARPGVAALRQAMTFDGTNRVTIVTTAAGGTTTRCVLDLAAPLGPGALSCA